VPVFFRALTLDEVVAVQIVFNTRYHWLFLRAELSLPPLRPCRARVQPRYPPIVLNSVSPDDTSATHDSGERRAANGENPPRRRFGDWRRLRPVHLVPGLLAVSIAFGGLYFLFGRGENLPDMSVHPAGVERKAAFFNFMAPIVAARNDAIRERRENLLQLAQRFTAEGQLSILDELWLKRLAKRYAVDWEPDRLDEVFAELRRRVDIVPRPLVLVQAAKESGWGTSRFAREANNLFGQWCFRKGCGLVPERRADGDVHEVRKFDSVEDAIDAYLHNINTGNSYARLRRIRLALRQRDKQPVAADLAEGLLFYSQRRGQYVDEVKSMLRQYHQFEEERNNP